MGCGEYVISGEMIFQAVGQQIQRLDMRMQLGF
jgi:hypothetical protein